MHSSRHLGRLCSIILLLVVGCDAPKNESTSFPQRPIKVIVPFAAGGGTDTFARLIQHAIEDSNLLPQPLAIINVPGASGTIGSRRVLGTRPDGYTILCLHEAILTAKYSGKVPYGPEAFEPIAGTGLAPLTICVAEDSPYQSLSELMDAAQVIPDKIVFSANIGAPSQFAGLMLESQREGALFRYTQTGGGAKRFAALKGGHVDVSAFSLAEYVQFQPAGLRALAICSQQRHPAIETVPTAIEQGFDCISQNMQFWWAPKGTDPRHIEMIASAIAQAMAEPAVLQRLANMKTDPIFLSGEQLVTDLDTRAQRLQSVSQRPSVPLPNFPIVIGIGIICMTVATFIRSKRSVVADGQSGKSLPLADRSTNHVILANRHVTLLVVVLLTISYVLIMQHNWLSFRPATAGFLSLLSIVLLKKNLRQSLTWEPLGLIAFAMLFAFGLHALFTHILVLDLP